MPSPVRYEIRAALPPDADELYELAKHLNSVNLPADRDAVVALLQHSEQSFSGTLQPINHRKYIFLLRDNEQGRAIGTSTIIAQLGHKDAPYIYFDVFPEERYSREFNLHFEHQVLRLGFSYDGPTELGGLVVDPACRRQPERLGLCISYARLLFIAHNPELFQDTLLAELLPPLEEDGTSHLWDAVGRRFTGMSYREADRLSHENKDFIRDLFPRGMVYASLLSPEARAVIGEVGEKAKGVEKMLRRIGFYYGDRIDPFDGGPHFFAARQDVTVIQRYLSLPTVSSGRALSVEQPDVQRALVATHSPEPPYFRAAPTLAAVRGEQLHVAPQVLSALGATEGQPLQLVPIP